MANKLFNIPALSLIICLVSFSLYSQTVYIDPANTGDPQMNGTIDHPWDSWEHVTLSSNKAFLQKCGTKTWFEPGQTEMAKLGNGLTHLTIGSYGTGPKPVTRIVFDFNNCTNLLIENVDVQNIQFNNCTSSVINNCVVHNEYMGVHISNCYKIKLMNTEIYNMELDGIMGMNSKNIEIGYCYIHNVNTGYKDDFDSGGDGIQFEAPYDSVHIHHTCIDRSNSGNKFGIILSAGPGDAVGHDWLIENCQFSGPVYNEVEDRGSCLHVGATNFIIRNSIFEDAPIGVYNIMPDINLYNNVFEGNITAVSLGGSDNSILVNNTFYNNRSAIWGGTGGAAINNLMYLVNGSDAGYNGNVTTVLTNMQNIQGAYYDPRITIGDPMFVDPGAFDFHLQAESPARDNGSHYHALTVDPDGNIIPNNITDIGAFEYYDKPYNRRPVAQHPSAVKCGINGVIVLDQNTSYDPDGDQLVYYWTCPAQLSFDNRHRKYPVLTIDDPVDGDLYTISLVVKDQQYFSKAVFIEIEIDSNYVQGPVDTTGNETNEPQPVVGAKQVQPDVSGLLIYPNPCKDYFLVHSQLPQTVKELKVFDAAGVIQPVHVLLSENQARVSANRLSKGLYFVRVTLNDGSNIMKKVLVLSD